MSDDEARQMLASMVEARGWDDWHLSTSFSPSFLHAIVGRNVEDRWFVSQFSMKHGRPKDEAAAHLALFLDDIESGKVERDGHGQFVPFDLTSGVVE